MESFLDEYQTVRLILNVAALLVVGVFYLANSLSGDSPVLLNVVALILMGSHAAWCRFHHIRAPKTMLAIDTTLLGAIMFTSSDNPSTMTGIFAFLAVLVALFVHGKWMAGFLAYLTAWYLAAFFNGEGLSAETLGTVVGNLFAVAAVVLVMARVRRWLGRLDAGRSQMIGTVSHELRNTLTGVLGLTEVVSSMSDLEPAEARDLVAMAHQQAIDANEIVEDLLTASRLQASALTINPGLVDINAEVTTVARRFHETDREIGLALADDLPSGWADPLRVRQTIRNLLSNAIRYGGPAITVITRRTGTAVEIIVRDDGDGVPEDEAATIFLPYRRSTRGPRHTSSIGLGLWICRQVVHAMGGRLEYRRSQGFTEFLLTVPIAMSDHESTVSPATAGSHVQPDQSRALGSSEFARAISVTA